MSDKDITLILNKRQQIGKGLGKLRGEGLIPAVIHNPGKDSIVVSGNYSEVLKAYQQAGKHHPIDLKVDKDNYFTIIKEVDIEPTKRLLRHVVFGVIKQDEQVKTEVQIELIGDSPAHKVGLIVDKQLYAVEIEALPRDLPEKLTVDATGLAEVGDKITVADIEMPKGVTILTEPEHLIAVVEEPTVQVVEEEPEAEATEGDETTTEGEGNQDSSATETTAKE